MTRVPVIELAADLLRHLATQRLRALLTLLGVAWGTLALVLLLAFSGGLRQRMHERAAGFGDGIALIWPQRTTVPHAGFGTGRRIRLELEDARALAAEIPGLEISPEYEARANVRRGARVFRVTLSGVLPVYGSLRGMVPRPGGRFLDERDVAERRRVAFLGDRLARWLYGGADPVGRTLAIRDVPFTVVGVLQPKIQDSSYSGKDEVRVCLPATTHEQVFGQRYLSGLVYRPADPRDRARVERRIYEVLGGRHRFDPGDRDALHVWDTAAEREMRFYLFLGFDLLLGLSGAFTLLVGGVGVAHLMHAVVRQRTREIGIQMAVGARPRQVLGAVLAQTAVLVAAGGAAGFVLAELVIVVFNLTRLTEDAGRPEISPPVAALATVLLGVVALLAGWFPARRAARLDPVRALTEAT